MTHAIHQLPVEIYMRISLVDQCWLWIAGGTVDGYGTCYYAGKNHRAHRIIYELLVGPIEAGNDLHHKFNTCLKRCTNPTHLEQVPHDKHPGGSPGAKKTHCMYGHEFTPENTYSYQNGKSTRRMCRRCMKQRQKGKVRHVTAVISV